jgi:hypothetical protein
MSTGPFARQTIGDCARGSGAVISGVAISCGVICLFALLDLRDLTGAFAFDFAVRLALAGPTFLAAILFVNGFLVVPFIFAVRLETGFGSRTCLTGHDGVFSPSVSENNSCCDAILSSLWAIGNRIILSLVTVLTRDVFAAAALTPTFDTLPDPFPKGLRSRNV